MKPTLAIGDVHGCTYWQQAVSDHPDRHVVFLGDYLDPYDYVPRKQLLANLQRIVELKLRRPHDVTLLLGNHDLHYFDDNALLGSRFDWQLKPLAQALFTELRSLFCYAYQDGNRLFTHAGVAHRWFVDDFGGNPLLPVSPQLNRPSSEQLAALFRVGAARGGRRGTTGGIFWADISELSDPLHGFTQVVGHNRVPQVTERAGAPSSRIIFCDCLSHQQYALVD